MAAPDRTNRWAVSKAWRSLPLPTRRVLVIAAVRGHRPLTDHTTWSTAVDWAQLYPALAGWQVVGGACFVWLTVRGVFEPFTWLVGGFACYLLVEAAWATFAASRIRRSPGPVDPDQPQARTVGNASF